MKESRRAARPSKLALDLIELINGSFWVGAAVGAAASIVLLDPAVLAPDVGWRLAFLIGAMLGLVIFLMRLWLPESPRWLNRRRVACPEGRKARSSVSRPPMSAW